MQVSSTTRPCNNSIDIIYEILKARGLPIKNVSQYFCRAMSVLQCYGVCAYRKSSELIQT